MDRSARGRSGTLSWQQRPASKDLGGKPSWPPSSQTQESSAKPDTAVSGDDTELSRSQIAQSLASKDPSWFRQTADRGIGSPALRKNQEETMSDTSSTTGSVRLPGLGRESTTEPEKQTSQEPGEERSRSPSRASSTFGNSTISNRYSSMSSVSSTGGLGSPVPLSSSQKLEPRKVESPLPGQEDQSPTSSSPRHISPERSVSPTKGLGGFVQSAMMKRSDNAKRWSAQAAPGLNRGSNILTNRDSTGSSSLDDQSSVTRDPKTARESSTLSTSRPGSSHSEATAVHNTKGTECPGTSEGPSSTTELTSDEGFAKPPLPAHSRTPSSLSKLEVKATDLDTQSPTSPSPSKPMDSKRWSPTKATWLESALNRPESPKSKRQPLQQPAWMKDLNKTKQSRGSADLGKPGGFKEVTPVGLMRSSAPGSHYKKPSVGGLSETVDSGETDKSKESRPKPVAGDKSINVSTTGSNTDSSPSPKEKDVQPTTKPNATEGGTTPKPSPPIVSPKPSSILSNTSTASSILSKPKQQSPVIDFRANLRRREITNDSAPKEEEEPEFKNVFGKLKKAETKNYVAPDELKENILRGKAALNATGGPKKSSRVDELKETILKQKEAIKAGGSSARHDLPAKPEAPIPEAILKRNNLSRSDSVQSGNSSASLSSPSSPFQERSPVKQSFSKRDSEGSGNRESLKAASTADITSATKIEAPATDADSLKQNTEGEPRGDNSEVKSRDGDTEAKQKDSHEETIQPVRALPPRNDAGAARVAAATKGLAAKGTLADRINPALAGLLSRGPPFAGGGANRSSAATTSTEPISTPSHRSTDSTSSPTLTHVTKTRAKGPKRRLPKTLLNTATSPVKEDRPVSSNSVSQSSDPKTQEPNPESPAEISNKSITTSPSSPPSPGYSAAAKISEGHEAPSTAEKTVYIRPKPVISDKSPELTKSLPEASTNSVPQEAEKNEGGKQPERLSRQHVEPERQSQFSLKSNVTLRKVENKDIASPEPPAPLPKSMGILPSQVSTLKQDKQVTPREAENKEDIASTRPPAPPPKPVGMPPSPDPTLKQDQQGSSSFPLPPAPNQKESDSSKSSQQKPVIGLGIGTNLSELMSSQNKALPSLPPVPPKKSELSLNTSVDKARRPSVTSPVPRTTESTRAISDFFDSFPKSSDRVDIDPQLILTARTDPSKIRTLKKQIWEITGDGKKQDLPVNQEYILYEGSMYLCVHVFEENGSQRSEVHLWCGDDVSEAAIEDAQLFARKVARENNCKLEVVRQGKETANFIQALGGIIITRRGSSSRSSSSALYMLCGRRHLGQIAFDEVDFSRRNLCSGYPFVISAKFGKLYLWKGRGSGADEVGGARLIGMDVGLTGEIEEVNEGEEPESFFEVFPDYKETTTYQSSDHWRLKPNHEKYCCRLLRVDHELGQRTGFWNRNRGGATSPVARPNDTVQEINPFCQRDIGPKGIYILDVFFELYV